MLRAIIAALTIAAFGGGIARAEEHPVVVELFTSQGCSSCPPADAMLRELAARDDVIALALHVDYWDYIGWADSFADPEYTLRQKAYARAAGERMIYTPQMIVGGVDHVVGTQPMEVADLIQDHSEAPREVELSVTEEGDTLVIRCEGAGRDGVPMLVQVVRYIPEETVDIERGENAGERFDYVNIVSDWEIVGRWEGGAPFELSVERGDRPLVVIVQKAGPGAVMAAARID